MKSEKTDLISVNSDIFDESLQSGISLHGGNLQKASKKYGLSKRDIIDFSANINPLGMPESALGKLMSSIHELAHYPDAEYTCLREKLAKYHGIASENIWVSNGATESIYNLIRAVKPFLRRREAKDSGQASVLIPVPSFMEYEGASLLAGCHVEHHLLKAESKFRMGLPELIPRLSEHDFLFIGNPNNPTGQALTLEELMALSAECQKRNLFLAIDEAFIDFLPDCDEITYVRQAANSPNIAVIRSFTKIYGCPGLRLGYTVASAKLIEQIRNCGYPWSVNSLAQAFGIAALDDAEFVSRTRELIASEREFLRSRLSMLDGIYVYPSRTNYLLVKSKVYNADILTELLAQRNILIRNCKSFYGLDNSYFRIAVKNRSENLKLIDALEEIFNENSET